MKSPWVAVLAAIVTAVVVASVAVGLAKPDGSVGDTPLASGSTTATSVRPTPPPSTPAAATSAAPTTAVPVAGADLAPAAVKGVWPGRPSDTRLTGDTVDWCPAVHVSGATQAVRLLGAKAVDQAACAAVRFVFEQRYSRLSLPRRTYAATDFDHVMSALAPATTSGLYRSRVARFVSDPSSYRGRIALGLVLLRGGSPSSAAHASAAPGFEFYGPAFSTTGYGDRAVWINPRWSTVTISLDRSRALPRIVATLTASAAIPVFDTLRKRDAMMIVPTRATYSLQQTRSSRKGSAPWSVDGWQINERSATYAQLAVG